ncbi:Helix-destabilising protein [compost metagenome]
MIKIQIEKATSVNKSGKSKRTGNDYSIDEQQALLFRDGESYPDKITITLKAGERPYPVGIYTLADESFVVAGFGKLEVRPVLVPMPVKQVA